MAASRINLRGSKRAGSEIYEGESVAGPSESSTVTPGERPAKKSKQAERRLCPLCNKLIPLHMLAQHTEMELAKVNEVIQDEAPGETGPSDPTASNNHRSAALRARASLIALAPTRRNTHPNIPTTTSPQTDHNPTSPGSERTARSNRRTRNSIGAGTDSMVERRRRRVGGMCPVCEDDVAEDLEEHVDRCLQDAVLPHRNRAPDTDEPAPRRREEPVEERSEELVRATDFTDFRGTGFDIRDRNIPDVDDDLDIDGDEDTVLYGESQFFEGDIIARDEEDDAEDTSQHPRSTPGSEDNEPRTRSLRDLVAARKMVLTLREVDIEGEEEDERVSVGSSVHMSTGSPVVHLPTPISAVDGKDAQIASLMAKVQELEASLHRQAAKANTLTPLTPHAKEKSASSTDEAAPTVCRICLDAFVEPVVSTGCWHLFCRECWLQSLGSTKYCPICKRITSTSNLRKVYL